MDLIRSWSQILFSRDLVVGGLLLVASLLDPWVGLHGLLAALVARAVAAALGLAPLVVGEGLFGYNAVLFGLGVGAMLPHGTWSEALLFAGSALTVVLTAALRDNGLRTGLPTLSAPFLIALWLVWSASPELVQPVPGPDRGLPEPVALGLRALGALLFVPRVEAGALVLLALLRWSRQGTVLGAAGVLAAWAVIEAVPVPLDPSQATLLALNLGLVSVALGGVWFVPSWASLALGAGAAGLTALVSLGAAPVAARLGLPLAIAPFHVGVWAVLLAMRQRAEDRSPRSVDFLPGTPEENLQYYRTRLARFGARYDVRFRAPVRGTWVVTQGRGDGPTHRNEWEHALDLEVADADGRLARDEGTTAEQHLCWHLPVVACADGVVAKVIDGVPDNPLGQVDLDDNWGNVVVLWHAPGLHSLVAHLSPRTIAVVEGQRVKTGEVLGLCGSSGRSPRPHLHWQLQATPQVGAPTLPLELHDVVDAAKGEVRGTWTPTTDDRLRNLVPGEVDLGLPPGTEATFEEDGRPVVIRSEIDPWGRRVLVCGDGRTYHGLHDDLFVVYDTLAPPGSPLHVLHAALARLPLEDGERSPTWSDHLPPRTLVPPWLRPLQDAVAPFVPLEGLHVRYRRVPGDRAVIEGRSDRERGGVPVLTTRAVLAPGVGLIEASQTLRGVTRTLRRRVP
ncbi:MAG: urea transporter [Alphaproteobacteria bacterium]|nr:urea transporter [Alphaproteobacteria bacterium]